MRAEISYVVGVVAPFCCQEKVDGQKVSVMTSTEILRM